MKEPRWDKALIPQALANVNSQVPGVIGTGCILVGTIDDAAGSIIQTVRLTPTSTNATTSFNATTFNLFLSDISSGTADTSNSALFASYPVPALSGLSAALAAPPFDIAIMKPLPQNTSILITQTVAAAVNTAWMAQLFGGNF